MDFKSEGFITMGKRVGYIRAKKYQELLNFEGVALPDELYVDLVAPNGFTDLKQYEKMMGQLRSGDTLVISSLGNICSSLYEVCEFVKSLRKKGVELEILNKTYDEESFISKEGLEILEKAMKFNDKLVEEERFRKSKRTGRPSSGYPEGFYEAFLKYKAGEKTVREIAEELRIQQHTFYNYVKIFD